MNVNTKFEPAYKTFFQRVILDISFLAFVSIIYWYLVVPYAANIYITAPVFILLFLPLLFFFLHSKIKYLKSVTIINEQVILEVVKFDSPYKTIQLDIQKVNIKIYDSFLGYSQKKFNLIIDTRNKRGVYFTVFKQRENVRWTLDIFKTIYVTHCEITGKPVYTGSLTNSGYLKTRR